jgi:aryl-alcohol dehydrogenase-like predicted oxidoreductase
VTATQVALACALHQPMNVFAVAGPRTPQETAQSFEAFAVVLTPDELVWLNLEIDSLSGTAG